MDHRTRHRVARAHALESSLCAELLRLGYWCVFPAGGREGEAPLWQLPRSSTQTRAPDLVVLGRGVIELKESRVSEGCVRLHSHQVRDYVLNWSSLPLPATIWICASWGDYRGDVGVMSLEALARCDIEQETISLPIMDLYRVGSYRDVEFTLDAERVGAVLSSI